MSEFKLGDWVEVEILPDEKIYGNISATWGETFWVDEINGRTHLCSASKIRKCPPPRSTKIGTEDDEAKFEAQEPTLQGYRIQEKTAEQETLLDRFAMAALSGILAYSGDSERHLSKASNIAKFSYQIAEEMVKARDSK